MTDFLVAINKKSFFLGLEPFFVLGEGFYVTCIYPFLADSMSKSKSAEEQKKKKAYYSKKEKKAKEVKKK